jgi:hypothetical protein
VRLFGEEPSATQPDEFFGNFEQFLVALSDAKMDNENGRKKREEDEKRAKQEVEVSYLKTNLFFNLTCSDYSLLLLFYNYGTTIFHYIVWGIILYNNISSAF